MERLEMFLVTAPGMEEVAALEAREQGFAKARVVPGGVVCRGAWPEVWRANLVLRVPGRVLVRLASFRAMGFRALELGLDAVNWAAVLPPGRAVRAEAATSRSRLYHAGAVKQRLEQALTRAGADVDPDGLRVLLRIEQITRQEFAIEQGSLYPALHRLEHKGLLTTEWGRSANNRRAKFYELSGEGRKKLAAQQAGWERFAAAIRLALEARPDEA